MEDENEQRNRRRGGGSGWIGIVIFLLIAFGSQVVGFLSRFLSQLTGGSLNVAPGTLMLVLIGGLIVLSVLLSVMRAIVGAARSNETRLPTSLPPQPPQLPRAPERSGMAPPRMPEQPRLPPSLPASRMPSPPQSPMSSPEWIRSRASSDINMQRMPGAPRFEPIVDPKVLGFGILGLLVLGGVFGLVFLFSSIP